jgi:hypothetical protein
MQFTAGLEWIAFVIFASFAVVCLSHTVIIGYRLMFFLLMRSFSDQGKKRVFRQSREVYAGKSNRLHRKAPLSKVYKFYQHDRLPVDFSKKEEYHRGKVSS